MPKYTLYETSGGRVLAFGQTTIEADALARPSPGQDVLLGVQGQAVAEYVSGGALTARPTASLDKTTIAADGTDTATLSNLPDPCTVRVNGSAQNVAGGSLSITASKPATYEIEIRDDPANNETAFPLQAFKATVEAT